MHSGTQKPQEGLAGGAHWQIRSDHTSRTRPELSNISQNREVLERV